MDVELVHAGCGGHLRWLEFQTFPTHADVVQRGIVYLFEDREAASGGERRWPERCEQCGAALQFSSRANGSAQAPVIAGFDGLTAQHA